MTWQEIRDAHHEYAWFWILSGVLTCGLSTWLLEPPVTHLVQAVDIQNGQLWDHIVNAWSRMQIAFWSLFFKAEAVHFWYSHKLLEAHPRLQSDLLRLGYCPASKRGSFEQSICLLFEAEHLWCSESYRLEFVQDASLYFSSSPWDLGEVTETANQIIDHGMIEKEEENPYQPSCSLWHSHDDLKMMTRLSEKIFEGLQTALLNQFETCSISEHLNGTQQPLSDHRMS